MNRFLSLLAAALFTAVIVPTHALAQAFPNKPLKIIVPYSPGGTTDLVARLVAQKLSERFGQPVVVDNKPGANGMIGADAVAKSPPDGYTLGIASPGTHAANASLYKTMAYDTIKDFTPVTLAVSAPMLLVVHPSLKVNDVKELIAAAKAKPGTISYASGGSGSSQHLAMEQLKSMAGIDMTHVPYKGSADAIKDVVAGHVQVMFSDLVPSLPLVAGGQVRALGVTIMRRWPSAPDIPPLNEVGVPGFDASGWFMISGPAGTPKPIVERLHADFKAVMGSDEVQQAFMRVGVVPVVSPPLVELPKFIASEQDRWGKVVKQAGLAGTL
jgi:tripartite-type tricarboxylate transporter receptor subunit TctC